MELHGVLGLSDADRLDVVVVACGDAACLRVAVGIKIVFRVEAPDAILVVANEQLPLLDDRELPPSLPLRGQWRALVGDLDVVPHLEAFLVLVGRDQKVRIDGLRIFRALHVDKRCDGLLGRFLQGRINAGHVPPGPAILCIPKKGFLKGSKKRPQIHILFRRSARLVQHDEGFDTLLRLLDHVHGRMDCVDPLLALRIVEDGGSLRLDVVLDSEPFLLVIIRDVDVKGVHTL
mmetsp:Transcript_55926/g.142255  ORF Transcript_55926/g.142255 Transcript_55926/m.142255 type:complete len:233 (-) Transcript_55926:217-915(-)